MRIDIAILQEHLELNFVSKLHGNDTRSQLAFQECLLKRAFIYITKRSCTDINSIDNLLTYF